MSDKPIAKPIKAWCVADEEGSIDVEYIYKREQCARDNSINYPVIPITITEGHGDELVRLRREFTELAKGYRKGADKLLKARHHQVSVLAAHQLQDGAGEIEAILATLPGSDDGEEE